MATELMTGGPAVGLSLETRPKVYREVPPVLQADDPFTRDDDGFDQKRVEYLRRMWHDQDDLLRLRDRQIEKHVRMLCGQHWSVYSQLRGRFIDLSAYLKDEEKRWRYMPVINRLLHWFMLLHARMTENPPVITFQPKTGDHEDAELAEVMDAVWKHLWEEASMMARIDDLFAWLIPAGEAYLKSRIDPLGGEVQEFVIDGVPFDAQGQPLVDEQGNPTGEPHVEYEGALAVDVLTPLQVRAAWGPDPWDSKTWHIQRSFLTPEEAFEAFGVDVEPNIRGQEAEDATTFQRLLYGAGFWGSAGGRTGFLTESDMSDDREYVEVFEGWWKPTRFPGMERRSERPGGRLMITAGNKRIRDGQRYAPFPRVSPIRKFDFVNVKGRPSGTSPEEMMVGPQQSYNRITAQVLGHATIMGNPVQVIDRTAGINEDQDTNVPGARVFASPGAGPPIQYIAPPSLSRDVWRTSEQLRFEMNELGNISGAEGTPPTSDASGELVKELRFNSDRFVGPTLRRAVISISQMAEDWQVLLPLLWDQEKILRAAGDERVATTVMVYPEIFRTGSVNVRPDVESMLPEGRGERQARIERHYEKGLFGPPGTPEAVDRFFELANFPHLQREARPGGVDRVMAETNLGQLARGVPAQEIPIFEWYEHGVHVAVLERFMKSPAFLRLDPRIMNEFATHREILLAAQIAKLQQDMMLQQALATDSARQQMQVAGAAQEEAQQRGLFVPGAPDRGPTAGGTKSLPRQPTPEEQE